MALLPRNILITGASSGIGAALARHYAAAGVSLALTGRDTKRLEAIAAACRERGAEVTTSSLDVTEREALAGWILATDDRKPLDLVVANAGIGTGDDEEATRLTFAVNLDGVLNTVLPIMPRLRQRRRGQIALMSSLAAFRGLPGSAAYSASKAAVKVLGEGWRPVMKNAGVGVSVICPGFVVTPMTDRNQFKMPFLMPVERAAEIIAKGLARDKARIAFPFPTCALVWLLSLMPPSWADRMMAASVND